MKMQTVKTLALGVVLSRSAALAVVLSRTALFAKTFQSENGFHVKATKEPVYL